MASRKNIPTAKSAGKPGKKAAKATTKRRAPSPSRSVVSARQRAAASGGDSITGQETAPGRVNDASDLARDQRLRKELEDDSARSPSDRHRERLTAIEAEEDGVRDDDDDGDHAADQRDEAISEQDADDDRA